MKRQRTSEPDHSRAEKTTHMVFKGPAKKSKASKKFEKQVLKVLKEPTSTGKYTQIITRYMPQLEVNRWSLYHQDQGNATAGSNADLEFFTPRQFKDAEAVLFAAKASTYNSFTTTVGNYTPRQATKVNNSSATFRFKNFSTHKMTLEMYVVSGKSPDCTTYPIGDFSSTLNNSFVFAQTGLNTVAPERLSNYGVNISQNHKWLDMWDCQKICFQFEPGEEAFHKLQGPKSYMMDGSKKLLANSDTLYKGPNSPGCGKYVFFRVMSNLGLVSSVGGTPGEATCFPTNDFASNIAGVPSLVGGIVVMITRHYNIEAPAGIPCQNAFVINNNMRVPSGSSLNNEIDADMPFGGPNTGL